MVAGIFDSNNFIEKMEQTKSQNVQVAIRIRPILEYDKSKLLNQDLTITDTSIESLKFDKETMEIETKNKFNSYQYNFDHLYTPDENQNDIFGCVKPLLPKFIEGYNCTVLGYGQTSSGKTYTIGTDSSLNENEDTQGNLSINYFIGMIMKSSVEIIDMLHISNKIINIADDCIEGCKLTCSFIEIYNDELVDLLLDESVINMGVNYIPQITIREDGAGKIKFGGINHKPINSSNDVLDLLKLGSSRRQTATTNMNKNSSRSHAIFTIYYSFKAKSIDSKFHFVDLAGSERLKKTQATGDRVREGIMINSGLLALGNVINALSLNTNNKGYIPYRDSKLTRMLQDSIGGNSISLMIACISPTPHDNNETINTLKYASRARDIEMDAKVNKLGIVSLQELKELVKRQQDEINKLKNPTNKDEQTMILDSLELVWSRNSALENDINVVKETYYKIQKKYSILVQAYLNLKTRSTLDEQISPTTENSLVNEVFDAAIDNLECCDPNITHSNNSEYEQKIDELNSELEAQRQELVELRVINTNTDIDDLEKQVNELNFDDSILQNQNLISELQEEVNDKNRLITELTRKIKEFSDIQRGMNRSTDISVDKSTDSGLDDNTSNIKRKESILSGLMDNEIVDLKSEITQLKATINEKEDELESIKTQIYNAKSEHREDRQKLNKYIDRLKSDIKENQCLIVEFETIIDKYEHKHQIQSNQISNHEHDMLVLKDRFVKEQVHLMEQTTDIKDQFTALNTQYQLKLLELDEVRHELRRKNDEFIVLNERFILLAEEEQLKSREKKGKFLCF